jgi:hypothetical protein
VSEGPSQPLAHASGFRESAVIPKVPGGLLRDPAKAHGMRRALCMIVKNEQKNIADCLLSVTGLFDEVIVCDTGSTDQTRELARGMGAKVVEFPWCENFSRARNASMEHATAP